MLTNNEIIRTLNGLIETCKDGQAGFWTAANGIGNPAIRQAFLDFSKQRALFAAELQNLVHRMGGTPETDGSAAAAFRRGWTNIKEAVTGKNEQSVLTECIHAEDTAVSIFQNALQKDLPTEIVRMVQGQYDHIREGQERIRNLKIVVSEPAGPNQHV